MARPEIVQTIARALNNVGAAGIVIGGGVSLAYNALFTGAQPLSKRMLPCLAAGLGTLKSIPSSTICIRCHTACEIVFVCTEHLPSKGTFVANSRRGVQSMVESEGSCLIDSGES